MVRSGARIRVVRVAALGDAASWLILSVACLLGGLLGHLLAGVETELLSELLGGAPAVESGFDLPAVAASLARLMTLAAWAAAFSFSAAGVIALPLLLAFQGFSVGYGLSALVRTWGWTGFHTGALWIAMGRLGQMWLLLAASVPGWQIARGIARGDRSVRSRTVDWMQVFCAAVLLSGLWDVMCRWLLSRWGG